MFAHPNRVTRTSWFVISSVAVYAVFAIMRPPPTYSSSSGISQETPEAISSWNSTGSLNTARGHHTATLLTDGKVLVAGGKNSAGNALATAELYDPASETWTFTGSLNLARSGHAAILLANGKVLVVGGSGAETSAELYDPTSGTWTPTGNLNASKAQTVFDYRPPALVQLQNGRY